MLLFLSFRTESEKKKFEIIYSRYKKLMLFKAYSVLRDYDLAQDAVSEAFIRVFKNMAKIDEPESGRTAAFLVMIVRNTAITMLNKHDRAGFSSMVDLDKADDYDLEGYVMAENSTSGLMKLIGSLKDELRTPFLLKYAYDMTLKEIGALLKISENNAAVRVHRARNRLSEMIIEGGYGYEI